jgi:hypothetical protein
MRIDGVGAHLPLVPGSGSPAAASPATSATSLTALVNQTLLQQEQKGGGGGGGHGGGHGAKKPGLEAIDDIASRASLNIKRNERTVRARMQEIEDLADELAAEDQAVGERGRDDDSQDERRQRDDDDEEAGA